MVARHFGLRVSLPAVVEQSIVEQYHRCAAATGDRNVCHAVLLAQGRRAVHDFEITHNGWGQHLTQMIESETGRALLCLSLLGPSDVVIWASYRPGIDGEADGVTNVF